MNSRCHINPPKEEYLIKLTSSPRQEMMAFLNKSQKTQWNLAVFAQMLKCFSFLYFTPKCHCTDWFTLQPRRVGNLRCAPSPTRTCKYNKLQSHWQFIYFKICSTQIQPYLTGCGIPVIWPQRALCRNLSMRLFKISLHLYGLINLWLRKLTKRKKKKKKWIWGNKSPFLSQCPENCIRNRLKASNYILMLGH